MKIWIACVFILASTVIGCAGASGEGNEREEPVARAEQASSAGQTCIYQPTGERTTPFGDRILMSSIVCTTSTAQCTTHYQWTIHANGSTSESSWPGGCVFF
jgi:hypothetical protein